MSPDDAPHGRVIGRNVDVDPVAGKDSDFPTSLHTASSPGPNLETTFNFDDERRVAV